MSEMTNRFVKFDKKAKPAINCVTINHHQPLVSVRFCILLVVVLLILGQMGPFYSSSTLVSAAIDSMNRGYAVRFSAVNVREKPDVTSATVDGHSPLSRGTDVDVLEYVIGGPSSYGNEWYKIGFSDSKVGYVVDDSLARTDIISANPADFGNDFEAYLSSQGFPDVYKPYLRELHAAYPNWIFEGLQTGLNWASVLDGENGIGMSLITDVDDAWKSTESRPDKYGREQIYDWRTDTWVPYDGSSWVTASKDLIAYYMDPRNMMVKDSSGTYRNIFQFLRFDKYNSVAENAAGVQKILDGNFMATPDATGFSYIDGFIKAAVETNVNPFHLASRSRLEMGKDGKSVSGTFSTLRIAAGVNDPTDVLLDGYYNFYNIGAYANTTEPLGSIKNGLLYAKWGDDAASPTPSISATDAANLIPWDNKEKAIIGGAKIVSSNYIRKLQYTVYYQKFNVINNVYSSFYAHQYMGAILAPTSESRMMHNAYVAAGDMNQSLRFSIPIYLNMPEIPAPLPPKTGNPNNWIRELFVNDQPVTPTFDPAVTSGYNAIFNNEQSQVNLKVRLASLKSSILINGQSGTKTTETINNATVAYVSSIMPLNVGDNTAVFQVTAENGSTREYQINIVRKPSIVIPDLLAENRLSGLSVNAQPVSPALNPDVIEGYSVELGYEVSNAFIQMTPYDQLSTLVVNNQPVIDNAITIPINVGENPINITVTSQNGLTRNYSIKIIRRTAPMLISSYFRISADKIITGINPLLNDNTTARFLQLVQCSTGGYQLQIVSRDMISINADQLIGTGSKVVFSVNNSILDVSYSNVIYGDSTGDGKINTSDLNIIFKHVMNRSPIAGIYLTAADANHDGIVNTADLNLIFKHVMGRSTITQ